jgi:hypothetical protein
LMIGLMMVPAPIMARAVSQTAATPGHARRKMRKGPKKGGGPPAAGD